jgi:hypothetical protein
MNHWYRSEYEGNTYEEGFEGDWTALLLDALGVAWASMAASWSTRSSITDFGSVVTSVAERAVPDSGLSMRTGTKGTPWGSKPGAMRRKASRFRRSFSSSRERRYDSRRAACATSVLCRALSRVRIWGSRVKGYTNCPPIRERTTQVVQDVHKP